MTLMMRVVKQYELRGGRGGGKLLDVKRTLVCLWYSRGLAGRRSAVILLMVARVRE